MSDRDFLTIENTLANRMINTWREQAVDLYSNIRYAIERREFARARSYVSEINLAKVGTMNREWLKYMLLTAGTFGATNANPDGKLAFTVGSYDRLLNKVVDTFILYLHYGVSDQVREELLQSIAAAEAADRMPSKKWDTTTEESKRFVKDFTSFAEGADQKMRMVASLHTSRLSTWGFVAEAEVYDITRYRLRAMLDNRTSDFCEYVANGREFDVETARRKINTILNADDPEELRTLQPWPKQDKASIADYESMSDEELADLGLLIPPFHPWCRTICVRIKHTQKIIAPDGATAEAEVPIVEPTSVEPDETGAFDPLIDAQDFTQVDEDTLSMYGVEGTPEQVQYWNDYVSVSPALLFGLMADISPQDVFDEIVALSADIDPETKMLGLNVKGPLLGDGSDGDLDQQYDPINNTLAMNYLDLDAEDLGDATDYVAGVYSGLALTAEALAAETVSLRANNTVMEHARMGFLPSTQGWDAARAKVLENLDGILGEELDTLTFAMVTDLLNSPNPKALWVLAELPYTVDGTPVAAVLFAGIDLAMDLTLTDKEALMRYNARLGS